MVLYELSMDDVDHLQRIFSDPEAMRFYPGTKNIDETKAWIQRELDRYSEKGYGLWACHLKETSEFVGQCGLVFWDDIAGQEEVEIGYLFVRQHWKKGLATEAAKGCLRYAREVLGQQRLISLIRPENTPSRAVAERLGMKIEKETKVKGFHALVYAT
jgi:RimJ/RimL family protein N-acetyltransferase